MRSFPVLVLCVLAVGCSPSSSSGSTTTVPTAVSTTAAITTTTSLSPSEARSSFVDCLSEGGLEVPSAAFDVDGTPRLGVLAGSLDTTDPAVQAAIAECSPLLSAAQVVDLAADPEVRNLVMEQLAAFTQCMRDQGIAEFPDPADGLPDDSPYPLEDVPFAEPGFDEALATCHNVVGSFGLAEG